MKQGNSLFTWLLRTFWIGGFALQFWLSKLETHRVLNAYHHPAMDTVMRYMTFLGDGIVAVLVSMLFMLNSVKRGLVLLLAFLISGGIVQFIKNFVVPKAMRPMHYFEYDETFYKIADFTYFYHQSFPSGHAATTFAIATVLAHFYPKIKSQLFIFVGALIIAYTRIYLSQHFLLDVLAGSMIGYFVAHYLVEWLLPLMTFEDKSLLSTFNKSKNP